jgi:SAM-dependent methyltransferase
VHTLFTPLQDASALVAETLDVLVARPRGLAVPAILQSRGWAEFLLTLDDSELHALECDGLDATWPTRTPATLLDVLARASAATNLPAVSTAASAASSLRRHLTPRKDAQVDAFVEVLAVPARGAQRVVDVGSGHGHLTREIAARLGRPVVGLERDARLVARARDLAAAQPAVQFERSDVLADGLALHDGDCVIGLHACGVLGDAMVRAVVEHADRGDDVRLVLVGCCLQKRSEEVRAAFMLGGPQIPRDILGLSNLTARDEGVEASRSDNLKGRERRLALAQLLEDAGVEVRQGAELVGLNRRAAHDTLEVLAQRAFTRLGRAVPSAVALAQASAHAAAVHARTRRLSLPRHTLARVLEVAVLADRALWLQHHGFTVQAGPLFPATVSARNLVLVAQRAD